MGQAGQLFCYLYYSLLSTDGREMWLAGAFWSGEDFGAVRSLFGTEAHLASHHGLTHPGPWLAQMGGLPRLAT